MRFVLDSVIQEEPPLKKVVKAKKKPITRKTVLKNLRRKTSLKEPPEVTSDFLDGFWNFYFYFTAYDYQFFFTRPLA